MLDVLTLAIAKQNKGGGGDIGGDGEISWSQLEGMSDDEILDTLAELGLIEPAAVEGRELFIDEGGNIYVL